MNDAFMVALNVYEEDELPLIRLLSKVKCKKSISNIK